MLYMMQKGEDGFQRDEEGYEGIPPPAVAQGTPPAEAVAASWRRCTAGWALGSAIWRRRGRLREAGLSDVLLPNTQTVLG